MKKLFAFGLSALLIIMVLASCGSTKVEGVPDGMKLVETESNLYSLFVPEDWIVDMSTGTVSAYVSAVDTSNITFTGFAPRQATSLYDFWNEYTDDFASTFGDTMKYINAKGEESDKVEVTTTTLGGYAANQYEYIADVTGDTYHFLQLTCIAESNIYIFTYTALVDNYDSNLESVQSILENFKFN